MYPKPVGNISLLQLEWKAHRDLVCGRGTFLMLGCANLNGIVPGKSGIQFQREDTLWVIWRKTRETSSSLLIQGALAKAAVRWELVIEPEQLQVTAPQLGCSKTFLNPLQLDSKPLSEHIPKGQQVAKEPNAEKLCTQPAVRGWK